MCIGLAGGSTPRLPGGGHNGRLHGQREAEATILAKKRESRISEIDGLVGNLVNLPGHSYRLCFGAHDDHDAGQLIAPEISLAAFGGSARCTSNRSVESVGTERNERVDFGCAPSREVPGRQRVSE